MGQKVKTTARIPVLCDCGSGYMRDRRLGEQWGCPACDPELGATPAERLNSYRLLIGTPVNIWFLEKFSG